MKPALTFRDRLYLAVSVLMVLLGLVMLLKLPFAWNMALAWLMALGFIGVGIYRLRVAWKALNQKSKLR